MKCFGWKLEMSKVFGYIKRPVAEISLKDSSGEWQPLVVYVDSGADVTILKRSFAELLNIEIKNGKYAEFGGVSGSKIKTYIHQVDIKIEKYQLRAKVAISIDDKPPNLLGRMDIFNFFEIQFKNRTEETCFKGNN